LFNPWRSYLELAQATFDINAVVLLRCMRLASGGALARREAQRMVVEKGLAVGEAQIAAANKMMMGAGGVAAVKSAARVYRRKVKSNRRRLAR